MSGKPRSSRTAPTREQRTPTRAVSDARPERPPQRAATPAPTPTSTPPVRAELLDKRDEFIHTFFRRGAELTEELLKEDESLRGRLRELESENARLRAQVASDDAIRDLLSKIEQLEKDKHELLSRFHDAEQWSSQHSARFADIEAENAKLASLYVASYQLHSTLDLPTIVQRIKELLAQFVGARALAIYVADDERGDAAAIASEGVDPRSLLRVTFGQGAIGKALASGLSHWVEGDSTSGTLESPAAIIPLRIQERTAGAIVVFATFEQKSSFGDTDFELFKLLGAHTASALVAARLFAQHGARIPSLDAFVDVE